MRYNLIYLIMLFFSTAVVAGTGMVINTVKRPYKKYGEWVINLNSDAKNQECRIKKLSKKNNCLIIECSGVSCRIDQTFPDHYTSIREEERSGYISKIGYFIYTQLDEIMALNKSKYNQWNIQGASTVLSSSCRKMKEWKARIFDSKSTKAGKMFLTCPFSSLNELKILDAFPAIKDKQIKLSF